MDQTVTEWAPAPAGRGWQAVSIVLVGAFMALLDKTITGAKTSTASFPQLMIRESDQDIS